MRFAILGCGSIGQRHLRNLLGIGQTDVVAFDPTAEKREEVERLYDVRSYGALEEVWETGPDVAFITAPSHLHLELSCEAAQHDCHLFIEKPLSDRMEGLDELQDLVRDRNLVSMVGCNTRFHHGPASIKQLLEREAIGTIISASLDAGQYLPDWQPGRDYRNRYSAHRSMGGGVLLDGIQELDYARWLFGEVVEVYCHGGKMSSLEMDSEDSVNVLVKFQDGFSAVIHLDCVQRAYARSCKVIGEEGTIIWDMTSDTQVRWFSAEDKSWRSIERPEDYDINDMYIEELEYFMECVEGRQVCEIDVSEGARLTQIALAGRTSMETGQPVRL